ncbi:MAG: M23 family metallopeptidase [Methanomicrobiales archaeon]|nr:M23 family metallopeptidase [Methanomicrobiales archaeon]
MKRIWPLSDSAKPVIPKKGEPGSFWEDRGDRHHCGVDLYAPEGCRAVACEDAVVVRVGTFTSPMVTSYWNTTLFVDLRLGDGLICRYAELGEVSVTLWEHVRRGHPVGGVGKVLIASEITEQSPGYIRILREHGRLSMLHFELWHSPPPDDVRYRGGNWFGDDPPGALLNPSWYLQGIR